MRHGWSLGLIGVVCGVVAAACGGADGGAIANSAGPGSPGAPGAGSPDGGLAGPSGIDGRGCDLAKLPTDDACTVHENAGVFVSASKGSLDGDGSRLKPLKSLADAIAKANADHKRVYACAETYAEQVRIQSGVSMFGYFDCAGWTVSSTLRARIEGAQSPAVLAQNVVDATRVEAFEINGPDYSVRTNGESSIAVLAVNAPSLSFVSATLRARNAASGKPGAPGADVVQAATAQGSASSAQRACTPGADCTALVAGVPGGSSDCRVGGVQVPALNGGPGGRGGGGSQWWWISSTEIAMKSGGLAGGPLPGNASTAAGASMADAKGTAGSPGAPGGRGKDGSSFGLLNPNGVYVTSDGTTGENGKGGQGGGGGGGVQPLTTAPSGGLFTTAQYYSYESGSGGGAGGCGGVGGNGGQGGGASIALALFESPVHLTNCSIESDHGGNGGNGGASGGGALAGGGAGFQMLGVSTGGAGGSGGAGGVGGGGGGGPSVGIVFRGVSATLTQSTVRFGAPGTGGSSGGVIAPTGTAAEQMPLP